MNKFQSFMNELEIEKLINEGNFLEALPLLLHSLEKKEYINKEVLLSNIAFCYMQTDNFEKARLYLQELVEINPKNKTALYNLALVYFNLDEYEKSAGLYKQLSDDDGMSTDAAYHLILNYLFLGSMEKAAGLFRYIIEDDNAKDMVYNLGIQMITSGFPKTAQQLFIDYLSVSENDIDTTFGLGISYIETKDYRKAIECFRRVLQWDKNRYPSVYVMMGMAYFEIGEIKDALQYIHQALKIDNNNAEAWYYLGVIYENTGNIDKAIQVLRKAGEISRDTPEIWEKLGYIYFNSNQPHQARINFKKTYVLTKNPIFAYKVGLIYMMEEDYQQAIDYLTLCLDQKGMPDTEIKENLGICYYHMGKYREAIELLRDTLKDESSKDMVYFILGNSYMKQGYLKDALKYLQEGLKLNSSNVNILYSLGVLEANQENFHEANSYLERALIIERNPDIIYALALAKMKLNDPESAVELFEEYRLFNQNDPEILYKLGLLYIQMRQFDQARTVFRELLRIFPENKKALEYLKDLDKYE